MQAAGVRLFFCPLTALSRLELYEGDSGRRSLDPRPLTLEALTMPYAEVAVNAAAPSRQTFTYRIPDGQDVQPGHAVYVPFGARTLQGIVMEVTDEPAYAEARDIEGLVEERPLVSVERLALARWLAEYYLAPLFDCVSL